MSCTLDAVTGDRATRYKEEDMGNNGGKYKGNDRRDTTAGDQGERNKTTVALESAGGDPTKGKADARKRDFKARV